MHSLYHVSAETKAAIDQIMALEDDVPQEVINDTLEAVMGELEVKQASVAAYIMNVKADVEAMKNYERSVRERRQRTEKRISSLMSSLMTSMQINNQREVPSLEMSIKIKRNPAKVVITNDRLLPPEYVRIVKEAEKAKIKEALAAGETVEGAILEHSERLEIK